MEAIQLCSALCRHEDGFRDCNACQAGVLLSSMPSPSGSWPGSLPAAFSWSAGMPSGLLGASWSSESSGSPYLRTEHLSLPVHGAYKPSGKHVVGPPKPGQLIAHPALGLHGSWV